MLDVMSNGKNNNHFLFSSLLDSETASIIEHRGYDSSEAATKVVCAFLIYAERLGMLI